MGKGLSGHRSWTLKTIDVFMLPYIALIIIIHAFMVSISLGVVKGLLKYVII